MSKTVALLISFRVSLKYLRMLRVRQGCEAKTSNIHIFIVCRRTGGNFEL